jgi:twitching motility protein PilT
MDSEKLIIAAINQNASDIHLSPGLQIHFRIAGKMVKQGEGIVDAKLIQQFLLPILNDRQKKMLQQGRQVDFAVQGPQGVRMRGNAFFQEKGLSVALRIIPANIPDIHKLGFPDFVVENLTKRKKGLVLIVGPTGQGKTTTLAAVLQEIAHTRADHIITVEDPVEFLLPSNNSIIQQREIGRDVLTFKDGIKAGLREDPDVLLVGEMRDHETISAVLTMAETGHLVFSTLHTNDGPQTISRIIDIFPPEQQAQVRAQLASTLSMVISQRLVPTISGKLTLAYEVLVNNYAVANYIRQNKVFQIPTALQTDDSGQMVQLEQSLAGLVINKIITKETALEYCKSKDDLESILGANGVQ